MEEPMEAKTKEEMRSSTLIMLTAKAAEDCSPCIEGYKKAALEAGATDREIDFALAIGKRIVANLRLEQSGQPADSQRLSAQTNASMLVKGEVKEQFIQQAISDENVDKLDAYFRSRGYLPLESSRETIRYQSGDRACTEVHLPYTLGGDVNQQSWISYHVGKGEVDLVGVVADFRQKERIANGERSLIQESFIVKDGAVVPGHACDTNCVLSKAEDFCGGTVAVCLADPPTFIPCIITFCGAATAFFCFECGCC
jgi:AhpD family alkylhydroperoxidase